MLFADNSYKCAKKIKARRVKVVTVKAVRIDSYLVSLKRYLATIVFTGAKNFEIFIRKKIKNKK